MRKLPILLLLFAHTVQAAQTTSLTLRPIENRREPKDLDAEIRADQKAVESDPKNRSARLRLVGALRRAGRFEEALREATAWRAIDAYNLVVVRLIGDIDTELGAQGRRAARVLGGRRAAAERRAGAARAGHRAQARRQSRERLRAADGGREAQARRSPHRLRARRRRAPAGQDRRGAGAFRGHRPERRAVRVPGAAAATRRSSAPSAPRRTAPHAQELRAKIDALQVKGGVENDIKIYLTWDTDKSDVDLWVTTPRGERSSTAQAGRGRRVAARRRHDRLRPRELHRAARAARASTPFRSTTTRAAAPARRGARRGRRRPPRGPAERGAARPAVSAVRAGADGDRGSD